MIKVLIVEDESLIRKGLVHTIDWTEMDCAIAGEAADGEEGLAKITELRPELVITDIKMPVLSGVDMLQSAGEIYDFEKIILTGYGEFEYAKKAIKLKVIDYLLKPIDEDKLKEAILKAKLLIEEKNIYNQLRCAVKDFKKLKLVDMECYLKTGENKCKHTEAAIKYIRENYNKKISIETLADSLGVSSSYLSRKFKEETSRTFHDFLNRYRVQQSIELLAGGAYRVYEISYMVGFNDYKHYCSVFKKYINSSPLEFTKAGTYLREESK